MIHQYKLGGYNIVLDVFSGSVHAVDDVAYDAIALIDEGKTRAEAADALAKKYAGRDDVTAADINDCLDDIDELTREGKLFAPDAYADHCGPHLQPQLQLLLCGPGQVPRRGGPHEF